MPSMTRNRRRDDAVIFRRQLMIRNCTQSGAEIIDIGRPASSIWVPYSFFLIRRRARSPTVTLENWQPA